MKEETKRLFTAIELPDSWLEASLLLQGALKEAGVEARFVPVQRLHLTLNFIGESGRLAEINETLMKLDRSQSPSLVLAGGDRFRRRSGGDLIVWQLEADQALLDYQRRERQALADLGLDLDKRPYRPHLTLARQARGSFLDGPSFPSLFKGLAPYRPASMTLFWSDRQGGHLVYRPVSSFDFAQL